MSAASKISKSCIYINIIYLNLDMVG